MSRLFRILTAAIIISAVGIGLCHAETIWEKRQKALKGIEEKQEEAIEEAQPESTVMEPIETEEIAESNSPIPLNEIFVPDQYGSIIETHEGTNGNLIVHIQDAHANYEAQKNIASIIEELINNNSLKLILKEGGISNRDYSYLRFWAPLEERKEKADNLLKKGILRGEEYLNIASDYTMAFQGIEDKDVYDDQINTLWEMDKFKGISSEYVNKLAIAADSLKTKIYNSYLLALDKAKKDYENESTDLLAYYKALDDIMQNKGIDITEFPNFANLMKINKMEQKIDLVKIRSGKATDEEKTVYARYQESLKKLNVNKLFKEEPLIENKIQEAVSENSDQKTLYRVSKALSTMDKMLNVKLVPEEYSYFLDNKKDFDPQAWSDFLKKKSEEFGLGLNVSENYYVIKDNMATIEKFYAIAGKRDEIFVEKSEGRMNKDGERRAILIAGGFHTPTLVNILSEKGYSYVVISPRVTTPTNDGLYRESLKTDWAPGAQ